jgi:hypothetical protein
MTNTHDSCIICEKETTNKIEWIFSFIHVIITEYSLKNKFENIL